jgi:hypothetical protein
MEINVSKRPDFSAEPFTNQFGQVINPGDKVMFIATQYKRTYSAIGTYEGVNRNEVYNYNSREKTIKITSVRVGGIPSSRFCYDKKSKTYDRVDVIRTTTLPLKRIFKLA